MVLLHSSLSASLLLSLSRSLQSRTLCSDRPFSRADLLHHIASSQPPTHPHNVLKGSRRGCVLRTNPLQNGPSHEEGRLGFSQARPQSSGSGPQEGSKTQSDHGVGDPRKEKVTECRMLLSLSVSLLSSSLAEDRELTRDIDMLRGTSTKRLHIHPSWKSPPHHGMQRAMPKGRVSDLCCLGRKILISSHAWPGTLLMIS